MNKYTSSSILVPGTTLRGTGATYAIERVLGQGSFGITYLAHTVVGNDDVEQLLCIKEFFMRDVNGRAGTSVTNSSQEGLFSYYRHKFEQESEHLRQLRHPGIVKVTDAFCANGTAYYAMQFVDGPSLDSYIAARRRLSLRQATAYACQIGAALQFMHERGMVHLDVKPNNVMLGSDGRAVLVDFGLSKQYDEGGHPESSTTVGAGTPGYAPIEQATHCEGQGVPVQMDVYALGATVFKMLTGQRPPDAADILNQGFPRAELQQCGVPAAVIDVVRKAMEPLCARRYKRASQLCDALERAVDGIGRTVIEPPAATSLPHAAQESAKGGTSVYVALLTFGVVLTLSCLPDVLISHSVCWRVARICLSYVEQMIAAGSPPSDDLFSLVLAGVPSAIGALVAIWLVKRKLRGARKREVLGQAVQWLGFSWLFSGVGGYVVNWYASAAFFEIFMLMSTMFCVQIALAIVTTFVVLRWFKAD